jgi:tyrosyl-tRNA synthetase
MAELSVDEKYELITRNLQEMIGSEDEIKMILKERPLKLYWGTAPTGKIHIGYFIQLLKIADYLKAGCQVTILFADLHAFLDNMKSSLEQLEYRTAYYETMIKEVLCSLGIDISKLTFMKGSDYQLKPEYVMDIFKLMSLTSYNDSRHSGADVVKQTDNPKLNGLVYPLLQVLDEHYLDVDAETSGIDQRKIFMYGRKFMPKIGYRKRFYFMTPMVSGLRFEKEYNTSEIQETKMSASNLDSKIDLLDTQNQIKKKINASYCLSGDTIDNSPLLILEKVIFPVLNYLNRTFIIDRSEKWGGPLEYDTINKVKEAFESKELHPGDLKQGISDNLNQILEPLRSSFESEKNRHMILMSYDDKYFKKNYCRK